MLLQFSPVSIYLLLHNLTVRFGPLLKREIRLAALFLLPLLLVVPVSSSVVAMSNHPACSVTVSGENVTDNAIQTAITEAELGVTGKTICIASGTYPEQLAITGSGIQLIGLGSQDNPTIIQPTMVATNTYDTATNQPIAAIILVGYYTAMSISGVVLQNLVVDGSAASSSFTSCAYDYMGILYQDASGDVLGNVVENIYLPPGLAGCQSGQGVFVQTESGQSSAVSISGNEVTNYDKNGITCNEDSTTCWISSNTVYPLATYQYIIASNGVQIAYGATGTVSDNTIGGNDYCAQNGGPATCSTVATGILTYESTGVSVSGNSLYSNDVGAYLQADSGTVSVNNNLATGGSYGGIVLDTESGASATSNTAVQNGVNGIELDSTTGSTISGNEANQNGQGSTTLDGWTGGSGFYLCGDASCGGASTGNSVDGNTANNNIGYGIYDGTGTTAANVQNSYSNNHCSGNTLDGSSPPGLCYTPPYHPHYPRPYTRPCR
jgi:parallel beta-helix repeat protein